MLLGVGHTGRSVVRRPRAFLRLAVRGLYVVRTSLKIRRVLEIEKSRTLSKLGGYNQHWDLLLPNNLSRTSQATIFSNVQ